MELKEIPGYEGYYGITVDGQVWSYISKRFLKSVIRLGGYYAVSLSKDQVWKGYYVHRLVMTTYGKLDLNDTRTIVHHIDGDLSNNHLNNLQIMSHYEHNSHHKHIFAKGYDVDTKTHKLCTKCEILKLRGEFGVSLRRPDGLRGWCRVCSKQKAKEYHQENKHKSFKN